MIKYLLVSKNGIIEEKKSRLIIEKENIYKLCGYKSKTAVEMIHCFTNQISNEITYEIYGKKEGRANSENKYELPPPVDTILLFGNLCVIKIVNGEHSDLTSTEWNEVYENLFGGFEDIGNSDDEERSMDSTVYGDSEYTKEGYHKDSFVIDDGELEEEEYI